MRSSTAILPVEGAMVRTDKTSGFISVRVTVAYLWDAELRRARGARTDVTIFEDR